MSSFREGFLAWRDAVLSSGKAARFIHIDRANKRNSLDPPSLSHLRNLVASAKRAVLVFTATPPAFCAGFDLVALRQALATPGGFERTVGMLYAVYTRLLRHPGPTIAIVDGPAVGGGVGLALCCDFVVATTRASFLLPRGPLRPLASIILPFAIRRGLDQWDGTLLSAGDAATRRVVDVLIDCAPDAAGLTSVIDCVVGQQSAVLQEGKRRPLDRRIACHLMREAFDPQAAKGALEFLVERANRGR